MSFNIAPLLVQKIMTLLLEEATTFGSSSYEENLSIFVANEFEARFAYYANACDMVLDGYGIRESRPLFTYLGDYVMVHLLRTMAG